MTAFRYLIPFTLLFLMTSCAEENTEQQKNSAIESLQMLANQKSYPNKDLENANYFGEIARFLSTHQINNREDLPEPWESIGPHNIAGRTLSIAINPQNNKTIFAGSASGGLWRSHNKGKGTSWEQVPLGFPVLGISTIAFAPNDSLTIYLGTGEVYNMNLSGHGAAYRNTRGTYGMGILKSSDGGLSWSKVLDWSYELQRGIQTIKVSKSDPNFVYAGTTHGTYKSIDGGLTWQMIHEIPMCTDLVIHPSNPNDVIIACGNFGSIGKGIYTTKDGGTTWEHFQPNNFQGKIQLAQFEPKPEIVYASIGNGFGFEDGATWLFKSNNRGLHWDIEGTTDYSQWQGWFAHDVAVNPFNSKSITMVGIEIYQSEDSGKTTEQITNGGVAFGTPVIGEPDGPSNFTHSDHHDIIYDEKDEKTIYVANDGGVYGSFDGGKNWQSLNGGYQTTQFYNGFSVFSSQNVTLAMGGLQDNSTIEYTGSKAWNRVIGGDGSWSAIHTTNPNIRYGSLQNLSVYRTTNGINYFGVPIPGSSLPTSFIAPYVIAPSDPNTIYAGRTKIFKSVNAGSTWTTHFGSDSDFAFSMDVSANNPDIMYFATAPNLDRPRIFVTKDAALSFEDITGDLPNQYINDVFVNQNDPDKVYITLGGFGDAQVFKSENAGQDWVDITGDLPKIPTSAILVDPADDQLLYLGNDYGIFYSEDDGANWSSFSQGITDAILVSDLKINASQRKIYVATHGNGAFIRDMIPRELPSNLKNLNQNDIRLLENPVRNTLNILALGDHDQSVSIKIFALDGKILYADNLYVVNQESIKIALDFIKLSGQYYLKIDGLTQSTVLPFICIK